MSPTDLAGVVGVALAISLLALFILPRKYRSPLRLRLLALALFTLSLIPFSPLSLAEAVRGYSGDLSLSSLVLLFARSILLPPSWRAPAPGLHSALFIVFTGSFLYVFALGYGMFDSYGLGYGHPGLLVPLFGITLLSWWQGRFLLPFCISLAALGWSMGLYESNNLWDYLLDPWLFIYAIARAIRLFIERKAAT